MHHGGKRILCVCIALLLASAFTACGSSTPPTSEPAPPKQVEAPAGASSTPDTPAPPTEPAEPVTELSVMSEDQMQQLNGTWTLVSGVVEGWMWSAEDQNDKTRLTLSYADGQVQMTLAEQGPYSSHEIAATLSTEPADDFSRPYPCLFSPEFTDPLTETPIRFVLSCPDENTVELVHYYMMDGCPAAATRYFWRENRCVDETAVAQRVREIVAECPPEDMFALWNLPDVPHIFYHACQSLGLTPAIVIGLAPELTFSVCEGSPVYENGQIVDWEYAYSIAESITLRRGEYAFVSLGYPPSEETTPYQYIELQMDGETYFYSLEGTEELTPDNWFSVA